MTNNWFELAKSVDIKNYLESFYKIEFDRNNKAICPFCGSSNTPAFSLSKQKPIVKCFSCMPKAMGIIDFVMAMEKCSEKEAAKKICVDMSTISEDGGELSDEQRAKKHEELKKRQEDILKQRAQKEKKAAALLKRQQTQTIKYVKEATPKLLNAILLEENKKRLEGLFNLTDKFYAWYFEYIGWDEEQESLCIINHDKVNNQYYNIKHRFKYVWDRQNKSYDTTKRMPGKWISQPTPVEYPFPIEYFRGNADDRVVLCFGEKDALNLLSLHINTLTLGGITNSFEPYKELFKNKTVYIFPDNQLIEYIAAMARYEEIKDVAKDVYIVSFMHIDRTLPQKYDVSDFILDNTFTMKDDFFRAVEYSCFRLTNSFIEEVGSFFYSDEKLLKRLEPFYNKPKTKTFEEIEGEILNVANPVKSEMDVEINRCELQLKAINNHPLKKEFQMFLGTKYDGEEFVASFYKAMQYKTSLFGQFRKQHEADVSEAFAMDVKRSGHDMATYRGKLYFWTGSHFAEVEDKELKIFIFQKWMKTSKVNTKQRTPDFMNKVATGAYYYGLPLENIKKKQKYRVINFDNGTAYLYPTGKFVFKSLHVKEDGATNILPFSYDKRATAPKWERFLSEVLPDQIEQDALMEFIGYCFLPTHSFQKFMFLLGTGANGKSIVLNVIRKFFGDSISNVDLQQLHSHEMVGIEGKYINIGSEINPRGCSDGQMENLKKLTAGEPTQLNPKNSTPYDIKGQDIAKFIFSGNSKPQGNMDDGIFRRMLLLIFNKIITKKERIQALEERFNDELNGIFNLAMVGLQRLLYQGDFSMSSDMKRNLEEYKEEANPIFAYLNENIVRDDTTMVSRKFLYAHYKTWCEERGHRPTSDKTFLGRMRNILRDLQETQPNYHFEFQEILGSRPRFLKGIRIVGENIDAISINKVEIKVNSMNINTQTKCPVVIEKGA